MSEFDVLNLPGPQFLGVFIILATATGLIAWCVRRAACSKTPGIEAIQLSPEAIAWLEGRRPRVAQVAVARLLHEGYLTSDAEDTGQLRAGTTPNDALPARDRRLLQALIDTPAATALVRAQQLLEPELQKLEQQLQAWSLCLGAQDRLSFRWNPTLIAASPLLLGAAKIGIGLSRDRPVVFLVMLMAVWAIVVWIQFARKPLPITTQARQMLSTLRRQAAAIRTQSATRPAGLSGRDIALMVGLFGISSLAMAAPSLQETLATLEPRRANTGDGSSSSSDSSSSDGGSDGGGDGGGGGCGGCGGGGGGD